MHTQDFREALKTPDTSIVSNQRGMMQLVERTGNPSQVNDKPCSKVASRQMPDSPQDDIYPQPSL